jgi:hypothetical protein
VCRLPLLWKTPHLSSPAAYGNSFVSFSLPLLSPKCFFIKCPQAPVRARRSLGFSSLFIHSIIHFDPSSMNKIRHYVEFSGSFDF